MCRYGLHSVSWFSYWIDNLGFITEGNTYHSCTASSLPLWGNINAVSSRINELLCWRLIGKVSSSCNLHYLPFASRFPLPHFTKIYHFIRPLFRCPFSCRICFCVQFCLPHFVAMDSSSFIACTPDNEVLNFKQREERI